MRVLSVGHYSAPRAFRPGRAKHVSFKRNGTGALLKWSAASGARVYRIKIRGSDGRVQTFFRKPGARSVQIANVLPFESFTATVTAVGGADLLTGAAVNAKLGRENLHLRAAPRRRAKAHAKPRGKKH